MNDRATRVVATAGHVDHGKSTLVLALTGTDPDRFPEEKARGLTIDLGFAFTELPSGTTVGFVDVPGHVRFVKNMLAGVGAVEVALLVIAANEGWMPQTDEHAEILQLLDIRHGVIALSKAATVDAETLELARLELEERTAGTALASWPVIATDAPTGLGLDELRAALDSVLLDAGAPRDSGRPRLWIDRAFSAKGAGTVVTGTLTGGALALDDEVVIEPGHRRARVRGIESHHAGSARVGPGARVALNLSGVDRADVQRGDAIVLPEQWATVRVVDVALRTRPGHELPRRGAVHAHAGSGEHVARLRTLDADGWHARLWLPAALPLAPGDRLVLRSSGRQATVGGAEVLDVEPAARAADALARLQLPLPARVMNARPWCEPAALGPLAGAADPAAFADALVADGDAVRVGAWLAAPDALASLQRRALDEVRANPSGVELASLASTCGVDVARLRAALEGEAALRVDRGLVLDATRADPLADPEAARFLAALDATPFAPPSPGDVGTTPAVVRSLVRAGAAVDLEGIVFSAGALRQARAIIGQAVVERGTLTVADVRNLLGSTRKFVVPIVKHLDAEGVTRRRGDDRIPGPRAQT